MSLRISGLVSSRARSLCYLLIACSLVVAIISILASIKVAAGTVESGVVPSRETINRARKGDRLPLVLASDPNPANRPVIRRSVEHSLMAARRWPALSLGLWSRTLQGVACLRQRASQVGAAVFG